MPHDFSGTHDPTGRRWEDRARDIAELHLEYGEEIDAEALYLVRRRAYVEGRKPRDFHPWPDNAGILRDARAYYGDSLTDAAAYVKQRRADQAAGERYRPLLTPEQLKAHYDLQARWDEALREAREKGLPRAEYREVHDHLKEQADRVRAASRGGGRGLRQPREWPHRSAEPKGLLRHPFTAVVVGVPTLFLLLAVLLSIWGK